MDPVAAAAARAAGADSADAVLIRGTALSVARRLGKVERIERAEGVELGLRVFLHSRSGRRQAIVSTTDTDPLSFPPLAERAVALARAVVERDLKLDALHRDIEKKAIRLIALRQPVASDLRRTLGRYATRVGISDRIISRLFNHLPPKKEDEDEG